MNSNNELFFKRCQKYFGKQTNEFIKKLSEPASNAFFLNEKKAERKAILNLIDFKYQKSNINDKSYTYQCDSVGKTKAYELGLIYPQDEESSLPVQYLQNVDKIKFAIDLCAAPGGKSINVLNRLNDDACLISNDVNNKRAKVLASNLERLGLTNVVVTNLAPHYFVGKFNACFDLVILDAPCSGEGMLRKYPEILDTYNLGNIEKLANIQSDLLEIAYNLLKRGGQLLYSTCTYAFEEDEEQITSFLDKHPDVDLIKIPPRENNCSQLEGCLKLSPLNNTEGQFICLMVKNGGEDYKPSLKKPIDVRKVPIVQSFIEENLNIAKYYLYKDRDNYYLSFNELINVNDGYLTQGIFLGTVIKKRFEPAYSLYRANALIGKFKYVYDLNESEYNDYVSGKELKLNLSNNYYLLTYHGHALGFGKASGGSLKNKYPKGLRRVI